MYLVATRITRWKQESRDTAGKIQEVHRCKQRISQEDLYNGESYLRKARAEGFLLSIPGAS